MAIAISLIVLFIAFLVLKFAIVHQLIFNRNWNRNPELQQRAVSFLWGLIYIFIGSACILVGLHSYGII